MKRITIIHVENVRTLHHTAHLSRDVICDGQELMEASDGHHTFTDLYDHRIELFLALARSIVTRGNSQEAMTVWRSKLHSDGTSFDGWYILGIGRDRMKQITYHLPLARWDDSSFAVTLDNAPKFDGHTPADVLKRLKTL
jgi:hypothetical protein